MSIPIDEAALREQPMEITETPEEHEARVERIRQAENDLESFDDGGFTIGSGGGGVESMVLRYVRARNAIAEEINRVANQLEAYMRTQENRIKGLDFVYGSVAARFAEHRLAGKKQKSIKLPFGTIGFRTNKELLEIENEAAVIEAAEKTPEMDGVAVRSTVTRIAKEKLDEYFHSTGAIPPGCRLRPESQKFFVK